MILKDKLLPVFKSEQIWLLSTVVIRIVDLETQYLFGMQKKALVSLIDWETKNMYYYLKLIYYVAENSKTIICCVIMFLNEAIKYKSP